MWFTESFGNRFRKTTVLGWSRPRKNNQLQRCFSIKKHTNAHTPLLATAVSSTPTLDTNRRHTTHKQRYHPRLPVRSSFIPSYSFRPTTVGYYFVGVIYWFYFIFTTRQPRRRCISVFSAPVRFPPCMCRRTRRCRANPIVVHPGTPPPTGPRTCRRTATRRSPPSSATARTCSAA